MAKIFLFNPADERGQGFTREGRCTQQAETWGTVWPPLSLACAAAVLLADAHEVILTDYSAPAKNAQSPAEIAAAQKPDFAFWPTSTTTLSFDLSWAAAIKKASARTITGVFGTHITVDPAPALKDYFVDVVIRGEPEGVMADLCRCAPQQWHSVKGLSYRDAKAGKIISNPDHKFMAPEVIMPPAWHLLQNLAYRLPLKRRRFLITAPVRGCPFSCSFCTASIYYGSKPRFRPIAKVVEEIAQNVFLHAVKDYFIWADTFTLNRDYVKKFCEAILDRKLNVFWTCNSRVDTLDEKMLDLMKKAGCWMISFGIESGNDRILAATGKGITTRQSRLAVQTAKKAGLKTAGHFMFGLPGETPSTMAETLELALALPLDIAQFYAATPFPGTKLYADALENNWLRLPAAMSQDQAVMDLPGLPGRDVDAFRRRAYRKFYMRPRTAYGILSMIDPGAQIKSAFSG